MVPDGEADTMSSSCKQASISRLRFVGHRASRAAASHQLTHLSSRLGIVPRVLDVASYEWSQHVVRLAPGQW